MRSVVCTYHPSNPARVHCSTCGRALCPVCDHRIKGSPYCEDCIVMGIDALAHAQSRRRRPRGRARLAALLALLPGMGAVYNRQNLKAFVHFATIIGLFQLAEIGVLDGLFVLAGVVIYFYSIVDAYRTGLVIAEGESPASDEERFRRSLARRAPMIGLVLIVVGLLMVVQLLQPFGITLSLLKLLPVALIIFGGYLITRYLRKSEEASYQTESQVRPTYNLIPGNFTEGRRPSRGRSSRPGDLG